jgi:subtilisin family serine protease
MKYFDKSLNREVELKDSSSEFIVVAKPNEEEGLHPTLNLKLFSVTPSSNADKVYVLRARTDTESLTSLNNEVAQLSVDERIDSIAPALIDAEGTARFALPNRVIVQFTNVSDRTVGRILTGLNSKVSQKFRALGLFEAVVPEGSDTSAFINQLNEDKRVAFAEPSFYGVDDQEFDVTASLSEPEKNEAEHLEQQQQTAWNLEKLQVPEAWGITRGGNDVVVAIVDGMPETGHEAMAGKFIVLPDASLIFSSDLTVSSHATNVCSVVAGESERMIGVAPDVRLLPLIVNLRSQVYAERAAAIRFVADLARAKSIGNVPFSRLVLSCSWRTSGDITVIRTAIEDAISAGVLVVFSAGNEESDVPHFPSDYGDRDGLLGEGVISVAATDSDDHKASYSNFSPNVTLCAPGGNGLPFDQGDILCADQNDSYSLCAGTSIAAPHIAAIAALVLTIDPDLPVKELKQLLEQSVDDINTQNPAFQNLLGTGRVSARKAVEAAAPVSADPLEYPNGAEEVDPSSEDDLEGPNFSVTLTMPDRERQKVLKKLTNLNRELESGTGWRILRAQLTKTPSAIELAVN